jgi:NAD(P) transhydrogenase
MGSNARGLVMTEYDFLVIGSGPAGQKAAIQGAKQGRSVCMIETAARVGGMCVHRGTIPSKALRESAQRYKNAHKLLGTDRPTALPPLMSNVDRVIAGHDRYIADQLQRNQIDLIHGRATFVSNDTVSVISHGGQSRQISGKNIFIATGSIPRQPDNIAIDHEHILDSDSILAMNYLPQSMLVLGGGVIACEYASVFASLGVEVTLVDRFPLPLGFLDEDLPVRFIREFERSGGRFIGEQNILKANFDGLSKVSLELESGQTLEAEKMLVALGRISNIKGLGIEHTDVKLNEMNLIEVNEYCQTHVPHVYAVGDVIGPPSLASSSMEQGRLAACHALGVDQNGGSNLIPVGIYAIPELSSVGLTESQARATHGDIIVGYAEFSEVARGLIADSSDGVLKMIADNKGEQLLGVHIVAEGASDLIHLGQMALIEDMPISNFVEQVFNFPTFAEAYRVAALSIQGQAFTQQVAENTTVTASG